MPVVEKTSGGRVNVRGIGEFVPGDQAEVGQGEAEYLVEERGDFQVVDAGEPEEPAPEEAETEAEPEPSEDTADESFDVDEWLDRDYQDRAEAVAAGDVDDHLEEIEDEETSETVIEAIQGRRDELEG